MGGGVYVGSLFGKCMSISVSVYLCGCTCVPYNDVSDLLYVVHFQICNMCSGPFASIKCVLFCRSKVRKLYKYRKIKFTTMTEFYKTQECYLCENYFRKSYLVQKHLKVKLLIPLEILTY